MAKKASSAHRSRSKSTTRRYVRRDGHVLAQDSIRASASGRVIVKGAGVSITGTRRAVEDYLDAQEIDRRLADPTNQERVPWDEIKARRGL